MSNFLLNSISYFIARRTDAAPQASAAQSTAVAGGEGASCAPRPTSVQPPSDASSASQASHRSSAKSRPVTGEIFEPSRDAAHGPSDGPVPLVAYPVLHEEVAPPRVRQSRALNLLRASTSVATASHATSATHSKGNRPHESHLARLVLTETEKVRLQVMQVQLRLTSLSLYEGPIDGVLGPETVTGVRYFQTLKGMRDTGTLAAGTLSALGVPPIV